MSEPEYREVEAFLAARVESYEELQVLLLLHEHRDREWTVEEIATTLGIRGSAIEQACAALCDSGLLRDRIESRGRMFGYGPRDSALDNAVAALARLYQLDRLAIVKLMSANAIERIRTAAMRTFADSFVIRKGKQDG
jgi:hypothetical protein